ncbi:MAG TPA: helix-turn-helix transcriptional regulator [Dehalococcoidia bacterium]|nr:helix-turn-helix transcriptional regulator [Dehalococcoidia bacterium]
MVANLRFGEQMQRDRIKRRINLRDLGRRLELSPVYLSDIERGQRRPPPLQIVSKIARVLEADTGTYLKLALRERKAVELPVENGGVHDARLRAALVLARAWGQMNDEELEGLATYLREKTEAKREGQSE